MIGQTFEELSRTRVVRGFFPEAVGNEESFIRDRVERHQNPPNDFEVEMADGRYLQISERAMSSGGIAVLYTDVTAYKHIELALRQSQRRFKDFAQATSDWYWETDSEHHFQQFSSEETSDLKMRPSIGLGKTRHDVAYPDELAAQPAKWRQHKKDLDNHVPFRDFIYRVAQPDASYAWVRTSGLPVFDEAGTFTGYRGATSDITIEVEEAAQARSARERLVAAMDGLNETFSFWDPDERLILANRAWRIATDRDGEDMPLGEKFEDIARLDVGRGIYPMPQEAQEKFLSERLANFRNPTASLEYQLDDNRWLTLRDEKLGDGSTISIGLDITDWKSSETARRSSEDRLAGILDTAAEAIVSIDKDLRVTLFNKAAEAVFGYKADEMFGQSINVLLPERFRDYHARHIDSFTESSVTSRLMGSRQEVMGLRKDGSEFPAAASISKFETDGETVLTVHVSDVTERYEAQNALMQSEEQFRRVFNESPLGMALVNAERRITLVNRKICEILGYSETELLGIRFSDITHPDDIDEDADLVGQALAGDFESYRREKRYLRSDGTIVDVNLTATIVHDQLGAPNFLGMMEDVTDRKSAEAQLIQAQKLETVGTLAGGIAHDFNNILAPMMGYSELAMEHLGPGDINYRYIKRLDEGIGRAAELVKQILSFTRPSGGTKSQVHVGEVVEEALKLIRAAIPAAIEIKSTIEDQSISVAADPSHIHQIVMNLCTNAAHAIPETGGIVETIIAPFEVGGKFLATHPTLHAGPHLLLSVSDTGHGMDEETRRQIFEPFFTTKGATTGTGLGLSTVYAIVKGLDGHISVSSAPGRGTRFDVYLPATPRAQEKAGSPVLVDRGVGKRILLVDDDERVLSMSEELLSRYQHRPIAFNDPADALEAFRKAPDSFDIVVTDQSMPKITGEKLARQIKNIKSDIPIVMITGYSANTTAESRRAAGIDGLVTKPFTGATLAAAIRNVERQTT